MVLMNPILANAPWIVPETRTASKIEQWQCREVAWTAHSNAHHDGWNSNISRILLEHPEKTIEIWAPLACRRSHFLERCLDDTTWDGRVTCFGVLDHYLALHHFIVDGYYNWVPQGAVPQDAKMYGDVRLGRKIAEPLFHAYMFRHLALWEIETGMDYAFTRFKEAIRRAWNNPKFGILVIVVHSSPLFVPLQHAIGDLCNEHYEYLAAKPDFMDKVRKIPGFVMHPAGEDG